MKNILILGAGRSASSLIRYLLHSAAKYDYTVTVADTTIKAVKQKTGNHPRSLAVALDIVNDTQTRSEISKADMKVFVLI